MCLCDGGKRSSIFALPFYKMEAKQWHQEHLCCRRAPSSCAAEEPALCHQVPLDVTEPQYLLGAICAAHCMTQRDGK